MSYNYIGEPDPELLWEQEYEEHFSKQQRNDGDSMKEYICWACGREYDNEPECCPECGGEIWTREEVEAWQGVEYDE